jgi:hypothetical protein
MNLVVTTGGGKAWRGWQLLKNGALVQF